MKADMMETDGNIGKKRGLTAEEMSNTGHIENETIRRMESNPGSPSFAPSGQAEKGGCILFRLMQMCGEIRHLGACIGQALAGLQAQA